MQVDSIEAKAEETKSTKTHLNKKLPKQVQRVKKVVSDSPGLVDFAIGQVNSVLNLPDGQVKIFWRIRITEVL